MQRFGLGLAAAILTLPFLSGANAKPLVVTALDILGPFMSAGRKRDTSVSLASLNAQSGSEPSCPWPRLVKAQRPSSSSDPFVWPTATDCLAGRRGRDCSGGPRLTF